MEKTTVTIDEPIVLGAYTILPVISLSLQCWPLGNLTTVSGVKEPVAFLVKSAVGKRIYGISGEELSTDQLLKRFPALKEQLARF